MCVFARVCADVWPFLVFFCVCARASEIAAGMNPRRPGGGGGGGGGRSVITQTCLHSKYVMKSCW